MDSNHRPPGPEPGALARLSHAPRLSAAIQVYHLGCSLTIPRAGLRGSGAPGPTRLQRKRTRAASNTTAFGAFSLDRSRGGPQRLWRSLVAFTAPQCQHIVRNYIQVRFLGVCIDADQILAAVGETDLVIACLVELKPLRRGRLPQAQRALPIRGRDFNALRPFVRLCCAASRLGPVQVRFRFLDALRQHCDVHPDRPRAVSFRLGQAQGISRGKDSSPTGSDSIDQADRGIQYHRARTGRRRDQGLGG